MTIINFDSKPVRRVVHARAPHGVNPKIVVSIHSDGTIGLREAGRALRTEQRVEVAFLYLQLIRRAIINCERKRVQFIKSGLSRAEARRKARKECGL